MSKVKIFSYLPLTILVICTLFSPILAASALDFDQDGASDFVLIDVGDQLQWSAIDLNDSARRSLGNLGQSGNHLAAGEWLGNGGDSLAIIEKLPTNSFKWRIGLSGDDKTFEFGSHPAKVISGLDFDKNGAIDPAVVSSSSKTLAWEILANPGVAGNPESFKINFGSNKALPFFANLDGTGDQLGIATLKGKALILRYRKVRESKVITNTYGNFGFTPSAILPAQQANGKDILFVITKVGSEFTVNIINAKQKVKKLLVSGDEAVVGKFLGGNNEVLAVRRDNSSATLIDAKGGTSVVQLDLSGILADDININTFSDADPPENSDPDNRIPRVGETNPACSGVANSQLHLLYKPVSDTSGNAVIVFDGVYAREFKAVRIELKDGTFAEGWWKGLLLWGNPDSSGPRQHWRLNVRASQVKDNALIIADDLDQECRFVLPGSSYKRWE